jgi:hypothetical protein
MSDQEVLATYQAREPQYRGLPGLVDKYYLRFDASSEHGAVYVWRSPEAPAEFRASELAASIRGHLPGGRRARGDHRHGRHAAAGVRKPASDRCGRAVSFPADPSPRRLGRAGGRL